MTQKQTERIMVLVSKSTLQKIDDIRFERRMHSRAELIRGWIEDRLKAEQNATS